MSKNTTTESVKRTVEKIQSKAAARNQKDKKPNVVSPAKLIFAIKDNKTNLSYEPILYRTQTDACRMLAQMVGSGKLQLSHFPEDFDLYQFGEWYEEGKIVTFDEPKFIINASAYKEEN
jgi:hypothetical protein